MFIFQKLRPLMDNLQIEDKSIRIQDMADGILISKKSLENYRDGKAQPTVEVLERIAIYFKKDMNYFFDHPEWSVFDIKKLNKNTDEQSVYKELVTTQKELINKQEKLYTSSEKENKDLRKQVEHLKNEVEISRGYGMVAETSPKLKKH